MGDDGEDTAAVFRGIGDAAHEGEGAIEVPEHRFQRRREGFVCEELLMDFAEREEFIIRYLTAQGDMLEAHSERGDDEGYALRICCSDCKCAGIPVLMLTVTEQLRGSVKMPEDVAHGVAGEFFPCVTVKIRLDGIVERRCERAFAPGGGVEQCCIVHEAEEVRSPFLREDFREKVFGGGVVALITEGKREPAESGIEIAREVLDHASGLCDALAVCRESIKLLQCPCGILARSVEQSGIAESEIGTCAGARAVDLAERAGGHALRVITKLIDGLEGGEHLREGCLEAVKSGESAGKVIHILLMFDNAEAVTEVGVEGFVSGRKLTHNGFEGFALAFRSSDVTLVRSSGESLEMDIEGEGREMDAVFCEQREEIPIHACGNAVDEGIVHLTNELLESLRKEAGEETLLPGISVLQHGEEAPVELIAVEIFHTFEQAAIPEEDGLVRAPLVEAVSDDVPPFLFRNIEGKRDALYVVAPLLAEFLVSAAQREAGGIRELKTRLVDSVPCPEFEMLCGELSFLCGAETGKHEREALLDAGFVVFLSDACVFVRFLEDPVASPVCIRDAEREFLVCILDEIFDEGENALREDVEISCIAVNNRLLGLILELYETNVLCSHLLEQGNDEIREVGILTFHAVEVTVFVQYALVACVAFRKILEQVFCPGFLLREVLHFC